MVARLSAALRDLVLAAAVLVATMVAVRVGLYGDLGSALGAVGVWGLAMAIAFGARSPPRSEPPRC